MNSAAIPTLLLTGTVGSGKTVVAIEIGHLLEQQGKSAAVVDLDWLGWVHLRSSSADADQLSAPPDSTFLAPNTPLDSVARAPLASEAWNSALPFERPFALELDVP